MDIKEALPYISAICVVASFWLGRRSSAKSDGMTEGVIMTKLDNLGASMVELKTKIDSYQQQVVEIDHRLVKVEGKVDTMWSKIDQISNHA